MLLPGKYIHEERTVVLAGARLIDLLQRPLSVTQLWNEYKMKQKKADLPQVPFDLFVFTLDFLFALGAIDFRKGKLRRLNDDKENFEHTTNI